MNIIEEPDCLDIWKDNGDFSINEKHQIETIREIRDSSSALRVDVPYGTSRPHKVNLNNTSNPKREVLINRIRDRIRKNKK